MAKYSPAPTTAAGLLRLARSKTRLTQSEIAELAGVSQQTISAYETGRMDPTISTLERLLGAAGLEMRIRLEEHGDHDESLEAYLETLPPKVRAEVEKRRRERVDQARLDRIRGN